MAPYLQRRGDTLYFRIAVPCDLRHCIGIREITKTLRTSRKSQAVPAALEYAARVMRIFLDLREQMATGDKSKLRELLLNAKAKIRLDELKEHHETELIDLHRKHQKELEQVKLQAENEAMRRLLGGINMPSTVASVPTPAPVEESVTLAPLDVPPPTLKTVIDGFLDKYQRDKKPAMYRKHKPVLSMLLEIVGDKPINKIKQADINDYFELVGRLPPRWADECRKRKLKIRELAELDFDVTLGPKTFDDNYIASVRPFLKSAKKDWQDQGFPLGLTTDGIEYLGDREEDENKQRAFGPEELKRLFQGDEMREFSESPALHHRYWIFHLGLFTGARVNEICQINPQTDIIQDDESGIWYLWITKETESDPRVRKSVKTGDSRKVPIHRVLIELGFLLYVARVKAAGHKLLFPEWLPINRRASGEAEKWVRKFFRDTGLRDETPKAKILGMHAFRHTFLTYGALQKPPLSLFCITGHAQDETPIPATGAGKGYLTLSLLSPLADRKELLDQLDYKLNFHKPSTP